MPSFVIDEKCDGCKGGDKTACMYICPNDLMVLDPDAMMELVFLLDTPQDGNGVLLTGLLDEDWLEPPFQGAVFFYVFSVFVYGCCSD